MKRLIVLFAIGICCHAFSQHSYHVKTRPHLLSNHYDLYSEDHLIAVVEQSALENYALLDPYGKEQAIGKAHLISIGSLFKSLKTIDISNNNGELIGWIKGDWKTLKDGKFLFYTAENEHFATAYVDQKRNKVTIVNPSNRRDLFALFHKKTRWEVDVIQEDRLSLEMLYIFSAFITHAYK